MHKDSRLVFFWTVAPLIFILGLVAQPGHTQQNNEPLEVTAKDVLTQLDLLILVDETTGRPAAQTFSIAKALIQLNELQIDYFDLKQIAAREPDSLAEAFTKDDNTFRELRAGICKQRPGLTRLIDLDGKLKPCG